MLILSFFVASAAAAGWFPPAWTADEQPTSSADDQMPEPTPYMELEMKRALLPGEITICGYFDGNPDIPFDCSGYPCGYNTYYDWFGCCATAFQSGTEILDSGCPIVTECVPYADVAECTGACAEDTMVTICSDIASPYCAYAELVNIPGMTWAGCDTTPVTAEVLLTPTGPGGSPTTGPAGPTTTAPTTHIDVSSLSIPSSEPSTTKTTSSPTSSPTVITVTEKSSSTTTATTPIHPSTTVTGNVAAPGGSATGLGNVLTFLMMLFNLM